MKAIVCLLLLVAASAYGAEEKKNEKRGLLGLGYGLSSAPLISHGYYGHGLGLYNHGLDYGIGLGGHDLGLGLGGHQIIASAPVISHSVYSAPILDHGLYGGKLSYGAPLLGLGHGHLGWH
ncbi:unnamed protein product [Parnassius apollo]|uniref:(apollo) hypothetical protein n=1 Tax=Parnassius apollo TaxID=110799 RepID=A0A8S3VZL6_PARAO|nr:unnamed protein product [Parnassius apollo]